MDARIEQLINALIEQQLDEREANELASAVDADPEVRRHVLQALRMHFWLAEHVAPVRAFSAAELRAVAAIDDHFDRFAHPPTSSNSATDGSPPAPHSSSKSKAIDRLGRWTPWFIAAAVLLTVAWKSWNIPPAANSGGSDIDGNATIAEDDLQPSDVVAHVRRKIDCDWAEDRWSINASGEIHVGQLITLTKGLLVLEFTSGAELTLNGPATLVAHSPSAVKLLKGEVSAAVPPQARGFTVETYAGDFVDLGTEFGLIVTEDGEVETHVFKGQVQANVSHEGDEATSKLLETGEGWARPNVNAAAVDIEAQPAKFLRPLRPTDEAEGSSDAPYVDGLALHYAADRLVQRDLNGRVSEWGDMTDPQDNLRRENAWQVEAEQRPDWLEHSIGGRPALRFDGYRGLVTEPLKLGPSHSSIVVFRTDGEVARELIANRVEFRELGVQLLNLNGPPHTVMQVSEDLSVVGRVHLGWVREQEKPVDVGFVRAASPIDNDPHVLAYVYDVERQSAFLLLDGAVTSSSHHVPAISPTHAPRFIGSHYERQGFGFTGDISEVLVYDGALTVEQAQDVSQWLARKYKIPTTSQSENLTARRSE
ncbi:MAG: FecR domain-containing protein [Planctomycetales bacterium]|nr:FecR domain-containing protein [Planctomycetales bacterium]